MLLLPLHEILEACPPRDENLVVSRDCRLPLWKQERMSGLRPLKRWLLKGQLIAHWLGYVCKILATLLLPVHSYLMARPQAVNSYGLNANS